MQPEEQCPHAAWDCTHSRVSGSFLESPPRWPSPRPSSSPEERGAPSTCSVSGEPWSEPPATSETQSSGRLFGLQSVLKCFELVVDLQQVSYQNPDLGGVFFFLLFLMNLTTWGPKNKARPELSRGPVTPSLVPQRPPCRCRPCLALQVVGAGSPAVRYSEVWHFHFASDTPSNVSLRWPKSCPLGLGLRQASPNRPWRAGWACGDCT